MRANSARACRRQDDGDVGHDTGVVIAFAVLDHDPEWFRKSGKLAEVPTNLRAGAVDRADDRPTAGERQPRELQPVLSGAVEQDSRCAHLISGSRGRPKMRSAIVLRMISDVPPAIVRQRANR